MNPLEMNSEGGTESKRFCTLATWERLISCMNTLMGIEIMLTIESFTAHITCMRSISGMRLLMTNKIRLISKSLATNLIEENILR